MLYKILTETFTTKRYQNRETTEIFVHIGTLENIVGYCKSKSFRMSFKLLETFPEIFCCKMFDICAKLDVLESFRDWKCFSGSW